MRQAVLNVLTIFAVPDHLAEGPPQPPTRRRHTTFYLYKNIIVGVKVANDKTYCTDYQKGGTIVMLGWVFRSAFCDEPQFP